jgi:DNA-binding GntR family transcriptional regulator
MAVAKDAQREIVEALVRHFDRSDQILDVEQIMEMTGLDRSAVQNALRVLYEAAAVEGVTIEEAPYPIRVTGVTRRIV